jgi:hypothetical protein
MKATLTAIIALTFIVSAQAEDKKRPIKEPPKTGEARPPATPPRQSESDNQRKPVDENYTPKAPQAR